MRKRRLWVFVLLLMTIVAGGLAATPSLAAWAQRPGTQVQAASTGDPATLWLAALGLSAMFVRRTRDVA